MERLVFIDNAKGIGIILMILGHIPNMPEFFHSWIYSFHMPLFFLYQDIYLMKKSIFV